MNSVFISYSREDLPFVVALRGMLGQAEVSAWVDVEGLHAGERYWPEIAKAIDAALALVFVISPESVQSSECARELLYALQRHKRIVPLLRRAPGNAPLALHPDLAARQWVFFRDSDDPQASLTALVSSIRADWTWLRDHARVLVRAGQWEVGNLDESLLLRGKELRDAEEWLATTPPPKSSVTDLQRGFVVVSRRASKRRAQQRVLVALAAAAIVLFLGWYSVRKQVANLTNLGQSEVDQESLVAGIGKLEHAVALCTGLHALIPACPDAELDLGLALAALGRYRQAVERLTDVIERHASPNIPSELSAYLATAYKARAVALIMLAESTETPLVDSYARADADVSSSALLYARSPSATPKLLRLGMTRARIHLGRGETALARQELDRMNRVLSGDCHLRGELALLLSITLFCEGAVKESIAQLGTYLNALPNHTQDPQWTLNKKYYARLCARCGQRQH